MKNSLFAALAVLSAAFPAAARGESSDCSMPWPVVMTMREQCVQALRLGLNEKGCAVISYYNQQALITRMANGLGASVVWTQDGPKLGERKNPAPPSPDEARRLAALQGELDKASSMQRRALELGAMTRAADGGVRESLRGGVDYIIRCLQRLQF